MPLTANLNIRKLRSHDSCVNAVAFSSNDGRWLGTGGDGLFTPVLPKLYYLWNYILPWLDRRLLIWDLWQEDIEKPVHTFLGANVRSFWLQTRTAD